MRTRKTNMAGKRARQTQSNSNAPSKSSMEESADALAGVEGALTGNRRKVGAALPKKKIAKMMTSSEITARPRSNSMEELAEVAGSILRESSSNNNDNGPWEPTSNATMATIAAAAAAMENESVPDPMAATEAMDVPDSKSTLSTDASTDCQKKDVSAKVAATAAAAAAAASSDTSTTGSKSDSKSKKTQISYNPDITMTKEQLTAWRREMRRVRNRESAAASRRKVRDRIEELEDEVEVWKKRYQEVMARLGESVAGNEDVAFNEERNNEGSEKVEAAYV